jgi:hypothetical protein
MDGAERPIWFLGDLDDPWVVSIAAALPESAGVHRLHNPGDLPDCPFDRSRPPRVIVLHRNQLTGDDAERLAGWRDADGARPAPALILCISPYVRYEELERWSRLVDLVLWEATAGDVLPGQVDRLRDEGRGQARSPGDRGAVRIEVAGGDLELCRALVEACRAAGYRAEAIDDREIGEGLRSRQSAASSTQRVLTIWEVPVLEPGWAHRLERRALQTGPIIALAGFADRMIVADARASGAAACLDLPCNLDDLLDVIDRTVCSTPTDVWPLPARLDPAHALPPLPQRSARRANHPPAGRWPDRGPLPRIPT